MSAIPALDVLRSMGARQAAAVWLERLARIESGDHEDPVEEALFRQWLDDNEDNRRAWSHALEVWDGIADANGPELDQMRRTALTFSSRADSRKWGPFALVASILLVVAATLAVSWVHFGGIADRPTAAQKMPAPLEYAAQTGRRREVTLADGSRLALDGGTLVRVAFIREIRAVELVHGRASFDVAHDQSRPFRVAAGSRVISVLGTRFDVSLGDAEMRVRLYRGSVSVTKGSDPLRLDPTASQRLSPGEELIARRGGPDVKHRFETSATGSGDFKQFDGSPLGEVATELNRYTTRKLIVRDPQVAKLRISGAFPTGDLQSFVETISALYPLRAVRLANGNIELVRRR